jgi:L-asparaginase II
VTDGVVRVYRGDLVESEHRFTWELAGEPGPAVFVRSAVKPLQALAAVRAGVPERFGLDRPHLAIASSSHGGGDEHVRRVREILAAAGRSEADLACGPGEPRDPAVARRGPPEPVRHNCSGKHALGLALVTAEGWPVEGYLRAEHPLQRAMRAGVAEAAEVDGARLPDATDGCGMRTFALDLGALAAAFGRLAGGGLGPAGERIAAAMCAHPELVAYDGAIDTELMRAHPGLVAKIGAEGVLGIGLPDGRGAALKVRDGAARALEPAAILVAREVLGVPLATPAVDALAEGAVINSRGERVGRAEAELGQ